MVAGVNGLIRLVAMSRAYGYIGNMKKLRKLTAKQERFAEAFLVTGNASAAYREAYNVGEDTKPETIWSMGCRILNKPNVSARVSELQEMAVKATGVTVATLTRELEEARLLAEKEGVPSSMVQATMGKAKMHGLLVDKVESKDTLTVLISRDDAKL